MCESTFMNILCSRHQSVMVMVSVQIQGKCRNWMATMTPLKEGAVLPGQHCLCGTSSASGRLKRGATESTKTSGGEWRDNERRRSTGRGATPSKFAQILSWGVLASGWVGGARFSLPARAITPL